jgi:hypothetical protein
MTPFILYENNLLCSVYLQLFLKYNITKLVEKPNLQMIINITLSLLHWIKYLLNIHNMSKTLHLEHLYNLKMMDIYRVATSIKSKLGK